MSKKTQKSKKNRVKKLIPSIFWFSVGFIFAGLFLISLFLIYFKYLYKDRVIPGVYIGSTYVGEKSRKELEDIFSQTNQVVEKNLFTFYTEDKIATFSAKDLNIGYDTNLITDQSLSIGKQSDIFSNLYIIVSSYLNGVFLKPSYSFSTEKLEAGLNPIKKSVQVEAVDALFNVTNNKVTTFRQSRNGKTLDFPSLEQGIDHRIPSLLKNPTPQNVKIEIPIKILKPNITTEKTNKYGIVELVGEGKSYFRGSIPNRIFNITLATSRINGILVAPGDTFSFNNALGDVSKFTGYKEAYIISNGRTILGDGGGVCQVSTTLFRALLEAGLPITERHAHAYRVGYYEQNTGPGLDATVYSPTVDLKFRNDTKNYLLIQSFLDPEEQSLVFMIFGKKDGRISTVTDPVILSETPAPAPLYQDDPTLPKGTIKQVDFAASGAHVKFTRTVSKDGKVIINETYDNNYTPWKAIYMVGTQ